MHRRIRRELGVPGAQGKRYSWGYGACPDLDDHAQVFKLLPVGEALGMTLTTAYQLVPEQSTAALIVHHPNAKYYAVRGTSPAQDSPPSATSHQPPAPTAAGETVA
jgi:5-methyltetrahydrofolate--homocysteine methyltransferase